MTSTGQRTAAKPARRSMSGIDGEVSVHLRGADACLQDAFVLGRRRPHRQQRSAVPGPLLLGTLGGFRERPGHGGCRVVAADLAEPFHGLGLTGRTRPSTYEHRSRGLLGVPSQVALHDEAPERCAEHHRRVQAELVDQAGEVVGPGVQVPVVRSAQITVAVPTPIGSERRKAFSPGLDADMLAAAGAR